MLGVVRLALASAIVVIAAGACSDASPTDTPTIRLPERDGGSGADGSTSSDGSTSGDGSSIEVQSCKNGVRDGEETDLDCGGPACPPCGTGRSCLARGDCASLVCLTFTCDGDIGCSDGTREGYAVTSFKNIAACSGAWSVPGLIADPTKAPACGRTSGNNGSNPSGSGCNVADLCQVGWHVCANGPEVSAKSSGLGCSPVAGAANAFFATRASGPGDTLCGGGANDLFGCGGVGSAPDVNGSCAPLDRASGDLCASLPTTFACGVDGFAEANNVTKANGDGGVLCCRD